MSDFFDKDPSELLSSSTVENRQKTDIIVEKIYEDFPELKRRDGLVYPSPIQPKWKN